MKDTVSQLCHVRSGPVFDGNSLAWITETNYCGQNISLVRQNLWHCTVCIIIHSVSTCMWGLVIDYKNHYSFHRYLGSFDQLTWKSK